MNYYASRSNIAAMHDRPSGPDSASGQLLPVGDPVRPLVRRAILGTLLATAVFSATAGPVKQVGMLYEHAPWLNDPYDTVVSFAMFFVPFTAAGCLARVLLCRRSEALPSARVADLLRGCRVVLGSIVITVLTEWISVASGANRAQWNGATWLQIGILAATTVLSAKALAGLRRVGRVTLAGRVPKSPAVRAAGPATPAVDWLADAVALTARYSRWFGRSQAAALRLLAWTDRAVVRRVRRHPVWSAAICAAAFGLLAGGWQALNEGYVAGSAILVITLLWCGAFAFLVGAGGYLGFVRSESALAGVARRLLDASVVTCAGLIVALAFRNSLWWIVGSTAALAGLPQFATLLGIAALTCFCIVFGAETVAGVHSSPAR
jgi:hypothetical protein